MIDEKEYDRYHDVEGSLRQLAPAGIPQDSDPGLPVHLNPDVLPMAPNGLELGGDGAEDEPLDALGAEAMDAEDGTDSVDDGDSMSTVSWSGWSMRRRTSDLSPGHSNPLDLSGRKR